MNAILDVLFANSKTAFCQKSANNIDKIQDIQGLVPLKIHGKYGICVSLTKATLTLNFSILRLLM